MKWLSLDYIKQHSRICCDCEDSLLELYGAAAEDTLLNHCNTTYDDLLTEYGEVPAPLYQASLMLTDIGYTYRSPASPTNMSITPYTFDILVKPYMKL